MTYKHGVCPVEAQGRVEASTCPGQVLVSLLLKVQRWKRKKKECSVRIAFGKQHVCAILKSWNMEPPPSLAYWERRFGLSDDDLHVHVEV